MAYEPTEWKDRVVEKPRTYTLQNNPDGTVTLIPAPGSVLEKGTPVNAANLNKLEQGLKTHEADDVQQTNEGQTEIPHGLPKCKYDATEPPTVNNDETEGYSVSSVWVMDTEYIKKYYLCLDATTGTAIWKNITEYTNDSIFYVEGFENEEITGGWIQGFLSGTGVATKEAGNLYLEVGNNNAGETSFTTDTLIDLSDKNTLKIEWEAYDTGSNHIRTFSVSNQKNGDTNTYEAHLYIADGTWAKTIDELDVSALNGQYYIQIHAKGTSSNRGGKTKVYRVWGE